MTYRDLLNKLKTASEEQLGQDVTVVFPMDEFYGINRLYEVLSDSSESGVLDAGHLVLEVNSCQ